MEKRQDEITTELSTSTTTSESKELDLEQAKRAVETNASHLSDIEGEISTCNGRITALHSSLEVLRAREVELNSLLATENVEAEKILARRSRLLAKREDAMRDIRELGTLPTVETYSSSTLKSVIKKL